MSKYQYSETEKQINSVLKHQDEALKSIHFPSTAEADVTAAKADAWISAGFAQRLSSCSAQKNNGYPYLEAMLCRSRKVRGNRL